VRKVRSKAGFGSEIITYKFVWARAATELLESMVVISSHTREGRLETGGGGNADYQAPFPQFDSFP
jgi:hypothetical protein